MFLTSTVLVLGSCSTTQMISSWKTRDSYPGISKILVLGLTGKADKDFCVRMEKHLATDLSAQGFNTFTSYDEFGAGAFDSLSEQQAIDKIKGKGFDAVITIVLLNKKQEKYYVPIKYKSMAPYQEGFWDYYTTQFERIYDKGYYEYATHYFWESSLYELFNTKLIYTCRTETFDPGSAESLGHQYGQLIVKDMVEKQIFPQSARRAF